MDAFNPFHSLRLLALAMYASKKRTEHLPKLIEVNPWEVCSLVETFEGPAYGLTTIQFRTGDFL